MNEALTPKAIVAALDEHIIGQDDGFRYFASHSDGLTVIFRDECMD